MIPRFSSIPSAVQFSLNDSEIPGPTMSCNARMSESSLERASR